MSTGRLPSAVPAFIGLGANLGVREDALRAAVHALAALPGTRLVAVSSLYGSAPVDAGGPDYLNAVAQIETALSPMDLLQALQALEVDAGRERPYRNAPRTLDLDVLIHGDSLIDCPELTVPHPRMMERAFVLRPLAELDPGRVSAQALQAVADQRIERLQSPAWAGWAPGP